MGLSKSAVKVLLIESKKRAFEGNVLTLGRQDVYITLKELKNLFKQYKIDNNIEHFSLSHNEDQRRKNYISDQCLLKNMGFSDCKAIDYSDYENSDYIFDLNSTDIPTNLEGKFDVIIDSGTIEHVFHLPNVFLNIYKMLNNNGRIIHISPSSNYIDHGFYMFSPTLFWDFYSANNYEINTFQIIEQKNDLEGKWKLFNYSPGVLNNKWGKLNPNIYAILCIATKKQNSSGNIIPQQNYYLEPWNKEKIKEKNKKSSLKEQLKKNKILYPPLRFLVKYLRLLKKRGLNLKLIDRL